MIPATSSCRRQQSDPTVPLDCCSALDLGPNTVVSRRILQLHRFSLVEASITVAGRALFLPANGDDLASANASSLLGLSGIAYHPITELDLTRCDYLSGEAITTLLPCSATLRTLHLNGCTGIAASEFALTEVGPGLAAFTSLRELGLGATTIGLDGLKAIPQSVEWLDLSETTIDTEGLHSGLTHLTALQFLNASATAITYERSGEFINWTFFEEHRELRGLDVVCYQTLFSFCYGGERGVDSFALPVSARSKSRRCVRTSRQTHLCRTNCIERRVWHSTSPSVRLKIYGG